MSPAQPWQRARATSILYAACCAVLNTHAQPVHQNPLPVSPTVRQRGEVVFMQQALSCDSIHFNNHPANQCGPWAFRAAAAASISLAVGDSRLGRAGRPGQQRREQRQSQAPMLQSDENRTAVRVQGAEPKFGLAPCVYVQHTTRFAQSWHPCASITLDKACSGTNKYHAAMCAPVYLTSARNLVLTALCRALCPCTHKPYLMHPQQPHSGGRFCFKPKPRQPVFTWRP